MSSPLFIVGETPEHVRQWTREHLEGHTVQPVAITPQNIDTVLRGQRDRIVIILPGSYFPEGLKYQFDKNIIIDLDTRSRK